MPIAYYGSKISPHMTKSPEGYLICHDVPINRIGVYKYLGRELGQDADPGKEYNVLRRPEEVFSKAALASFEGKPITDEHPPEILSANNVHAFEKGHAQNIRRGTSDNDGYTIADLYITDRQLVNDVLNGKREISCGYNFELIPNVNGTFEQRGIRGNHIAVVDKGRAGNRVAIKDSKPNNEGSKTMGETKKGGILGMIMKIVAKDDSIGPDELERISKLKEPGEEEKDEMETKKKFEMEPNEATEDEALESENGGSELGEIKDLLKKLISLCEAEETETDDELEELANGEDPKHEEQETGLNEEMENDGDETPEEQEPSVTIPAEEIGKRKPAMDSAKVAAKVVMAALKNQYKGNPKAYKVAAKDAAAQICKAYNISRDDSGYSRFAEATRKAAQHRAANDSYESQKTIYDVQQNYYDAVNPHKNKEAK
jgi:hypothetical protein